MESSAPRRPRLHHYVPKWHLGLFSNEPERRLDARPIWRFAKAAGDYREIRVRHAAVQNDYYSFPRGEGETPDRSPEQEIARAFDSPASRTARKLLKRERLTDDERMQFAAYIAFLHGRVPSTRLGAQEVFDKFDEFLARSTFAMPDAQFLHHARDAGIEGHDNQILAMKNKTLHDLESGRLFVRRDHAATMSFAAISVEVVTPILFRMHWTMLCAPDGLEFVISDNPVTLYSESTAGTVHGVGFGLPDVEVRVPLARNTLLLATHLDLGVEEMECAPDVMTHLNYLTWRMAQDYVFASNRTVLDTVAGYFDDAAARQRPGRTIEIYGDLL